MDPVCNVFLISLIALVIEGRDVPALQDICGRSAWSFCPQSAANNRPRPPERLPAADVPPSNSAPSPAANKPSPPSSSGEYCGKFQPHFMFFCDAGEAKEPSASDFCSDYLSHCILKKDGADSSGLQQIAGTPPPALVPCATYRPQFTRSCTTQIVTNPQTAQFCQTFQTYCVAGPTAPPTPAPAVPDAELAMAQIRDKCNEYKNAAKLYCTGPVTKTETAQVKQYCDIYRQYCVSTGFASIN